MRGKKRRLEGEDLIVTVQLWAVAEHQIKEGKKRRRERNHISYTTVLPLLSYDQISTSGMSRRKLLWRKMLLHSEAGRKPGGLQQLLFLSSM